MMKPRGRAVQSIQVGLMTAVLAVVGTASAFAQGGFAGIADSESLDTLSGISSPTGAGQVGLDRARSLQASDPFASGGGDPFASGGGGDPFGAAPGGYSATNPAPDPFGVGGGSASPDPFAAAGGFGAAPAGFGGGGFGPGAGPGGAAGGGEFAAAPIQIPTIQAIYGTRVVCHVSGELLEDAYEVPVLETFKDQYYDDGKTGMDYKANDFKYTNVSLKDDVMSPEAHVVKTRLIQGLRTLEDLQPNEFFNLLVASSDPLASVPQMLDLEKDRDEKLLRWAEKFLQDFRVNPEESAKGTWKFHPTYMPPPPIPPTSNIPATFLPPDATPAAGADGQTGTQASGRGGAANALGNRVGTSSIEDNPAASSSYF